MDTYSYKPEGQGRQLQHAAELERAQVTGAILEARAVLCGRDKELYVELPGGVRGVIPREETALGADRGQVRDIAVITRVGKPVCFRVLALPPGGPPVLSRRSAQEQCMAAYAAKLRAGDVIPARVTHLEPFGAFADIGCGIVSLLPIDGISVSRISHPGDRFFVGQDIYVAVRRIEADGRLLLTHRELLGTWEENAAAFSAGQTAAGIVRGVEPYGAFVELTPNLSGLAERRGDLCSGQEVAVYIKSILPSRMKIKLVIVSPEGAGPRRTALHYRITDGHLDVWRYSPESSPRVIETVFS